MHVPRYHEVDQVGARYISCLCHLSATSSPRCSSYLGTSPPHPAKSPTSQEQLLNQRLISRQPHLFSFSSFSIPNQLRLITRLPSPQIQQLQQSSLMLLRRPIHSLLHRPAILPSATITPLRPLSLALSFSSSSPSYSNSNNNKMAAPTELRFSKFQIYKSNLLICTQPTNQLPFFPKQRTLPSCKSAPQLSVSPLLSLHPQLSNQPFASIASITLKTINS